MPSLLRAACAALVFAFVSALTFSPATADSPKHVQVVQSFEPARNNGTPLVQVRFSNILVGTFAIDTGEIESVITEPFARKADFKLVEDENSLAIGLRHVRFVQPPEIKLANLSVMKPTFRVVAQDFLPEFNGRRIDGILGGNFLSQFALRIDYPAHEIDWIMPGNLNDKAAAELGFTPQNQIGLTQEHSDFVTLEINHYSLRADLQNGEEAAIEDMFIDTGSPVTLVSAKLAEELKLRLLAEQDMKVLNVPAAPYHQSTIPRMQVGQSLLTNVAVLAAREKDSKIPPILGENVLSNCVVLFDFGPHRFYLKPVLPPAKTDAVVPADKKQIDWDRLRAAPDLPTVEEMLEGGLAPDAADTLSEQAGRLRGSDPDSTKNVVRLEKLGALLRDGQDEIGATAAFKEAAAAAKTAAAAHPGDGVLAGQWVDALMLAGRDDEAIAAATQKTVHLPADASGWRQLGQALTSYVLFLVSGERITLTEAEALKLMQNVPDSVATPAQTALVQPLLAQAYAAFNKSVALAPTATQGYRERGLFRLASRIALTSLQQVSVRITLPSPEVPTEDTAQALAIADWQQCAALSPDDVKRLAMTGYLDQQMTFFHNRPWLTARVKGKPIVLPSELMTADTVQARLAALTKSPDKTLAASAGTALGTLQLEKNEASPDADVSWRQALTLDPTKPEPLRLLAAHLRYTEKWTDLQSLLTEQCAVRDSVPLRLTLAVVLNGESLTADAEAQVRAARTLAPENATVNLVLADLLLARSSGDPAALSEAAVCLGKARLGYGTLATAEQKATLATSEAVWLALDHDPAGAEKQLAALAAEQPNCTQVREALAALVPY